MSAATLSWQPVAPSNRRLWLAMIHRDGEERLVLLRRDALAQRGRFAETEEAAQRVAEGGE